MPQGPRKKKPSVSDQKKLSACLALVNDFGMGTPEVLRGGGGGGVVADEGPLVLRFFKDTVNSRKMEHGFRRIRDGIPFTRPLGVLGKKGDLHLKRD